MKLSKPEEMDEFEEPAEEQSTEDAVTVEVFEDEMEIGAAVELMGSMLERPEEFGIATESDVIGLNELIEEQREAIAELAEAVEILSQNQGQMAHDDENAGPSVLLDSERLSGIYDPTEEF